MRETEREYGSKVYYNMETIYEIMIAYSPCLLGEFIWPLND